MAFSTAAYLYAATHLLHRVGDEGTVVYGAQRVLEGQVPYRDFLELIGPGSFYWLALFFKLFGVDWQVTRFYLLLNGTLSAFLVYLITRRFIRGAVSLLPWLAAVVLGMPFWPACSHHWDSNLFALLGLLCFLKWHDLQRTIWLIAAGTLAAVTSCFMQHKGLLLLVAFIVTARATPGVVRAGRTTSSTIRHLLAAYAGIGGCVLLLFYRAGAVHNLLYANLLWPLFGYETVNKIPYSQGLAGLAIGPCSSLLQVLPVPFAGLIAVFCLLPFIAVIVAPLLLIAGIVIAARNLRVRGLLLRGPIFALVTTALALWLSEVHRSDMVHLLFGSPVLLTALFVSAELLFHQSQIKNVLVVAIGMGVVLLGCFKLAESRSSQRMETRRGIILDAKQDDALQFLNSSVKRREWVFVYPYYPMYYYLADIRNPTRFSILIYHYNTPENFDEVIQDLESKHVKYVLWDTVVDGANLQAWFPAYVEPPQDQLKLERYLHLAYDVVSIKNGFRILRRNRY